jgi:hypothetical protein
MDEAASALERAGLTVDDLLAGLDEARDEVVIEHYGAAFMAKIESLAAGSDAADKQPRHHAVRE